MKPSSTIQIRDAKARLSEVLRRVERGESIAITRRGVHVATIIPPAGNEEVTNGLAERVRSRRERLRREGRTLSVGEILDARDEGRR